TPGVVVGHGIAVDLGGMKVEEDVTENAQGAAARGFVVLDAQYGLPDVGLLRRLDGLLQLFYSAGLYGFGVGHYGGNFAAAVATRAVAVSGAAVGRTGRSRFS